MDIRILRPGDEDLLGLAIDLTEEGPLSRERAAAHLADESLVNLAAVENGRPVGFIYGYVLRRFEKTSFFIYSVDVAELFRRQGVAKAMLRALSELGSAGRWDEMFVVTNSANEAGMALYRSAGAVRPNLDDVMFDFYN